VNTPWRPQAFTAYCPGGKKESFSQKKDNKNMRQKFRIIISASVASLLAFSALAQDTPGPKTGGQDRTHDGIPQAPRPDRLSDTAKASDVIGMTVINKHDEKLGKVENILVDLPAGRVVAVIVSSGGFLGTNNELRAVPPAAFRFTTNRETLQLDVSKEMMGSALHFKANQWPDFAQPGYVGGVYRTYNIQPYFTTNASTEAANRARGARDYDDQTLTPLDQGHSQADIDTAAQIRKEIIASKAVSVDPSNVKIIALDGVVGYTVTPTASIAEAK
jgi:hypothetical protein